MLCKYDLNSLYTTLDLKWVTNWQWRAKSNNTVFTFNAPAWTEIYFNVTSGIQNVDYYLYNWDGTKTWLFKTASNVYTWNAKITLENKITNGYFRAETSLNDNYVTANGYIDRPADVIRGKPRVLKDIGKKAETTIFWVHIDNTRITQDAE